MKKKNNLKNIFDNLDLSKDKSNVTFELSFMVNGQYRSKDYEKIISDFAF